MLGVATFETVVSGEGLLGVTGRCHRPNGSRRGVIVPHGATVLATAFRQSGLYLDPIAHAANAGYPCLCVDAGGASPMGNDASVAAVTADITTLQTQGTGAQLGAKTGAVYGYGGSMGALTLLNHARANPSSWAGLFLSIPVLDLDDIYQNDKGGFRSLIGTAYGVTYPTAIPNLATHSPAAYSAGSKAGLTMPIKIWASTNDPVASAYDSCVTWAASVGSNVSVVSLGAVGHSALSLDAFALAQWLDSVGGRTA